MLKFRLLLLLLVVLLLGIVPTLAQGSAVHSTRSIIVENRPVISAPCHQSHLGIGKSGSYFAPQVRPNWFQISLTPAFFTQNGGQQPLPIAATPALCSPQTVPGVDPGRP